MILSPSLGVVQGDPMIAKAQAILNALGYNSGTVDGWVGWRTRSATKKFQADYGLVVDGVLNPSTMTRLLSIPVSVSVPEFGLPPPTGEVGISPMPWSAPPLVRAPDLPFKKAGFPAWGFAAAGGLLLTVIFLVNR